MRLLAVLSGLVGIGSGVASVVLNYLRYKNGPASEGAGRKVARVVLTVLVCAVLVMVLAVVTAIFLEQITA